MKTTITNQKHKFKKLTNLKSQTMKTKPLFLAICIITLSFMLLNFNSYAQAPLWDWAKTAGGDLWDDGNAIAEDGAGNIYAAGFFSSDSITFGSFTLYKQATGNLFLVKYNANGTVIWAKQSSGTDQEAATSVTTDVAGNIYVAGWFNGAVMNIGSYTLTNAGTGLYTNLFFAKYDPSGNVLWAKSAGGNAGNTSANSIAADAAGNVYITGSFFGTNIIIGNSGLTSQMYSDVFIAKYDTNGNGIWGKMAGGTGEDVARSVTIDATGNVLIMGDFDSSNILFSPTTLTNVFDYDIFVAKYNTSGTLLWVKSFGGNNNSAFAACIKTDNADNIYITGSFFTSLIFGSDTLINPVSLALDIFITKLDSTGNSIWAKTVNNSNDGAGNQGVSLDVDNLGNIFLTGQYQCTTLTFGSTILTNSGGALNDIFAVKYSSTGIPIWAASAGSSTGADMPMGICIDASGDCYISGVTYSDPTCTFGSITCSGAGYSDMFIAKLTNKITGTHQNIYTENNFSIFPNPASSELNVNLSNAGNLSVINIYDLQGRLLLNEKVTNNTTLQKVNVSSLIDGLYFIELNKNDGQKISHKFMKN